MLNKKLVSGTPVRILSGDYVRCVGYVERPASASPYHAWVRINGITHSQLVEYRHLVENWSFDQTIRNDTVKWADCPWQPKTLKEQ